MTRIKQFELDAHRAQLNADVRELVEKHRSIFGCDVPERRHLAVNRDFRYVVRF